MTTSTEVLRARLRAVERSAKVRRYHTEHLIHPQTVGEHTYGVVWFVVLLTNGEPSRDLLLAALSHDMAEHLTGDLPAPVKRATPHLKTALDTMEDVIMLELELRRPQLEPHEAAVLKMADCFDGAMFTAGEIRRGNTDLEPVFLNFINYLYEHGAADHPVGAPLLQLIKEKAR